MNIEKGFYTQSQLAELGFKHLGKNVLLSRNSTIIGTEYISIDDFSRIDDYCILIASAQGQISIGKYVHVAGYALLSGGNGIVLEDFSGISHGVKIYSRTDDYSGQYLTNPTVPPELTGVIAGKVTLRKHSILGSGTVVLPDVEIGEGASVGAQSLVTKSLPGWFVYFGCPAKKIKPRKRNILELEKAVFNPTKHNE